MATREAHRSSKSLTLTRPQDQSVDNISMWAKNEETAVPDSPVSESSSTGSVIHVAQSLNKAVTRKRVAVSSPEREPHRQLVKRKSISLALLEDSSQRPEISQLPDGYSSPPRSSPPQGSHTSVQLCGTPQIEAAPQTATQTSFPATDDVVSQISDGLLEKLSPAIISSIETPVRDRVEIALDVLYSKQATLLDEQMASTKKLFRDEVQQGLETLYKRQSHELNMDTAQTNAQMSELAAMVTAQSQAVNNAIEKNQSLSARLEVKSTDRFQSLSGQLSLLSTKVDLLTERISQVESLGNQVAETTSQIDDLRNKVTEMSTDFGANVSTSLNTLESCVLYLAYTLKLQIRELESKLSGSQHAEASTNNCEIPATLNEPYSTGGTEIGPQDTAPSGSVSTGLKASAHYVPETPLGSPIQQDGSQTHLPEWANIHPDRINQVKTGLQPEDEKRTETSRKPWKVFRLREPKTGGAKRTYASALKNPQPTESQSPTNPAPNNEGWKRVERRQKPTRPKSTKVKLVIRGVDNGRRTIDEIKAELNKDPITRQIVAKYFKWEYSNRKLLQNPGHRCGGLTLAVFSEDGAEKLIKRGIQAYGQRRQVIRFSRANANSECANCGGLGHLERTCLSYQGSNKKNATSHIKPNLQRGGQKAKNSKSPSW
jgi:hypothetical protein